MTQVAVKFGGTQAKAMGGTDPEDPVLIAGGILIEDVTYQSADDRVYDMRGVKQFSFSITNQDGANGLTWRLQQTEDPVPEGGDMTGATWVDIDAEATLAAGITAKKEFTRTSLLLSAVRLQVRETIAANPVTYKGRMVVGNYL